jgi:hypothetical protein
MLSFDIITVFDNNIIEAFAKQTGWNDDYMSIEEWILLNISIKVNIELENDNNSNKMFIRSVINENNSEECIKKKFNVPLVMCKDEFLTQIMKICGYMEDRYNNENVVKYILDTQIKNKDDSYNQIYVEIPMLDKSLYEK